MEGVLTLKAAGGTDPGRQRAGNEDQFHVDASRGLFLVIDGVGGQAAGGQAAEIALVMLRARLERETGPASERVRQAIAVANNEIHRLASTRPEWNGMACVLTVAAVKDERATVGHVGDTRLYKIRQGLLTKVTRDHSPVGEREDSGELSESDAMHHPRRNEVYRDVGSEPHAPDDPDFVDLETIAFEPDAALLLCSDGLTDLVPSATIGRLIFQGAGDPATVVRSLIAAANDAGGKDNVTVVYVEGERFAPTARRWGVPSLPGSRSVAIADGAASPSSARAGRGPMPSRSGRIVRALVTLLVFLLAGLVLARPRLLEWLDGQRVLAPDAPMTESQSVRPGESIAAALASARPGSQVVVEPGEYREQIVLRDGVRLVSRVPRGATIRLPATAPELSAAVVASRGTGGGADFVGFRIVGDAATPLGTGVRLEDSALSIIDVEIVGATNAALDLAGSGGQVIGAEVHGNTGAAILIRADASPRISGSTFLHSVIVIETGARAVFERNVFRGVGVEAFAGLPEEIRASLARDNLFIDGHTLAAPVGQALQGQGRGARRGQGR